MRTAADPPRQSDPKLSAQPSACGEPRRAVLSPRLSSYFARHIPAAALPISAGALLYGWAALGTISAVMLSTLAALAIWRHVGRRGGQLCKPQCLWMALLLALALPPHLLPINQPNWPILIAAGLLLVAWSWLLSGLGSGRVHPVLATYLTLVILFQGQLMPHYVLNRNHLFAGNLFAAEVVTPTATRTTAWAFQPPGRADASYFDDPASQKLTEYTSGRYAPDRSSVSVQMLLRDQLPPLEDFIIGGEPGPIGTSSALAVLLGGLFLMHSGMIDWRIPVATAVAALAALLILPIPVVITDMGARWHWMAFLPHYLNWQEALTLANYELLASPLVFCSFFLATPPQSRPMNTPARIAYAVIFGLLAAPAQLYISVATGPYIALFLTCLSSRMLECLFQPRPRACPTVISALSVSRG